jgi:hypothetical protein
MLLFNASEITNNANANPTAPIASPDLFLIFVNIAISSFFRNGENKRAWDKSQSLFSAYTLKGITLGKK